MQVRDRSEESIVCDSVFSNTGPWYLHITASTLSPYLFQLFKLSFPQLPLLLFFHLDTGLHNHHHLDHAQNVYSLYTQGEGILRTI